MKLKELFVQALVAGSGAWIGIGVAKLVLALVPALMAAIAMQAQ